MTIPTDRPADSMPLGHTTRAALTFGSRASALALWQTRWVIERVRAVAPDVALTIVEITTRGDKTQHTNVPLSQVGDKAMFVAELERALLVGMPDAIEKSSSDLPHIDAAVHSLKDLPGQLDARFMLAAITERADPRDALVSRHGLGLRDLPRGAVVATSSLRRKAQLLHARPDLKIVNIRGNVDTRLRKTFAADGPDATILAYAGLARLGLEDRVTELLPVEIMVPAVGQGALAVEIRATDEDAHALLGAVDHQPTRECVLAERAVLATIGGGCFVPLGAHATLHDDGKTIRLIAVIASPDGSRLVRADRSGPASQPDQLGQAVASELLAGGARSILDELAK